MDRKDVAASLPIRQAHGNAAIEAAGAGEGGIQHIHTIGGRQENHAGVIGKPIHFREELIQGLFPFVISPTDASSPLATDSIDLIDEHDAGSFVLGLFEQITDAAGSDPNKQLDELGRGDREKRHAGFTGDGSGQECLPGSRWAHQQHAFWNTGTQTNEGFRLFQKGDDLLQLLFGIVDASDVIETDREIVLGFDPWLTSSETEGSIRHLSGPPQQKRQADDHDQNQGQVAHQACHGGLSPRVFHGERGSRGFSSAQNPLVIGKHRDLHHPTIGIGDTNLPEIADQFKRFDLAILDLLQQSRIIRLFRLAEPTKQRVGRSGILSVG